MRVIVGFFGISRGLAWTAPSIRQHIHGALDAAGVTQVRVAQLNRPAFLEAPRSAEVGLPFDPGDLGALDLDACWIEPQHDEALAAVIPHVLRVPLKLEEDPTGRTRINALHQLRSLRQLGSRLETMGLDDFDAVVLVRPDLLYLDPLPVVQTLGRLKRSHGLERLWWRIANRLQPIDRRKTYDLFVPAWQRWGGHNDRFAICTPEAARIFLNRIDLVPEFCAGKGFFHPETLLAYALKKAGLRVGLTGMRAARVRTDGSFPAYDIKAFGLPASAGTDPSRVDAVA